MSGINSQLPTPKPQGSKNGVEDVSTSWFPLLSPRCSTYSAWKLEVGSWELIDVDDQRRDHYTL
jgi:hypothetical protein